MRDRDEMHWDRIAMWLMAISVFMFLIAAFMAMRNGTNIIGALALSATGAGMLATVIMAMMTIFPRGNNTAGENLRKKVMTARYTAIAMAVTLMGMTATLMGGGIIHM